MTANKLRNLVLSALTALAFTACGGGNKHVANAGGGGSGSAAAGAACTSEECAAVAEPPIAPNACGDGHEKDIGTACQRSAAGACEKVLQCNGAAPAAAPAP
jgi:hypothetical protein